VKFDIAIMQQQANAGMQGSYIMYQDEDNNILGMLGPFGSEASAKLAMNGIIAAETAAVQAVDDSSPWALYPYFWHHAKVVTVTPHELDCLIHPDRKDE